MSQPELSVKFSTNRIGTFSEISFVSYSERLQLSTNTAKQSLTKWCKKVESGKPYIFPKKGFTNIEKKQYQD